MVSQTKASQNTSTKQVRKDNVFSNSGGGNINVGKGDVTLNSLAPQTITDTLNANRAVTTAAMKQAFGFGNNALNANTDTVKAANNSVLQAMKQGLDTVQWQNQQNADVVSRALQSVDSAKTGGQTTYFKYTAIAVAVAAGAMLMKGN